MCSVELKNTKKFQAKTVFSTICHRCIQEQALMGLVSSDSNDTKYLPLRHARLQKIANQKWAALALSNSDAATPMDDSSEDEDDDDLFQSPPASPTSHKSTTSAIKHVMYGPLGQDDTDPRKQLLPDEDKDDELQNADSDDSTDNKSHASDRTIKDSNAKTPSDAISNQARRRTPPVPASDVGKISQLYMDIHLMAAASDSNDPMNWLKIATDRCKEWLSEIQKVTPSFKLHTIDPLAPSQEILHDPTKFPTALSDVKNFFLGIRPNQKGGKMYMKILASFNGSGEELLSNTTWYHKPRKELIRIASIQAPAVALVGWLLYSTKHTDGRRLKEALETYTGCEIALRFMRISDGAKYDSNRDTSLDPKALHVETAKPNKELVKSALRRIYGSDAKKFPLHLRMRFVAPIQDLVDIGSVAKFHTLRNRQDGWCRQHQAKTIYDIVSVDTPEPFSGKSLRDMIMEISASSGNSNAPLFAAVDASWNGDSYVVSFHPDKTAEASMVLKGLYPRLKHQYGPNVDMFFSPNAIEQAQHMRWDPSTNRLTSQDDEDIDGILTMDDDFTVHDHNKPADNDGSPQRPFVFQKERTNDDDSISTLGTHQKPKPAPVSKPATQVGDITTDSCSDTSSLTTGTMRTRMSTIETQMSSVNSQMENMTILLEKFLASQAVSFGAAQAVPTGTTPANNDIMTNPSEMSRGAAGGPSGSPAAG